MPDSFRQRVHFLVRVVHVEGGPGGGLDAERPVQRLRAVVSGPHRDAQVIEDLADVVRVHPVHRERDGAAPVGGRVRPEDAHEVGLENLDPRTLPTPGDVGGESEGRLHPALR